MNVLIIGGAGFLGANLVRYCLGKPNHRVTVLDLLDPMLKATTANLRQVWDQIRFVRGDMADETVIASAVQGQDIIFNCAAQTSHPLSLQDPVHDAEINCVGNLKVLEAVRLLNPSAVIVYTSSSTVVGRAADEVVDERHGEKPLDIYSANKGAAEKYYRIYNRVHDLKTVVLRFANLYGPYGKGFPEFGFVNYFISLASAGQQIDVFGSGEQTRNVLYVDDATEILYCAAQEQRLHGEVFFATSDEHLSVLQIAREIIRVFGSGKLNHVAWPETRKRIDIENVRISSELLRKVTGWKPRNTFVQGLEKTRDVIRLERG